MVPKAYQAPELLAEKLLRRGKVRDIYQALDGDLVLVATDRISAFDVVLEPGIPGKGVILTQLSNFWFARFASLVKNHLQATELADLGQPFSSLPELAGRAVRVRKLRMVPVECVVRGFLAGSSWKEYQETGKVCGISLPPGLQQAEQLPEPIFTPATKEDVGHDVNITFDRMVALVGGELAETLRTLSLKIYREASNHAISKGIIIADTKFEFGIAESGELFWADEALTPDSSRFWPAADYRPGTSPASFDKQFVRDFLEGCGWDKTPPAPTLPEWVVEGTLSRYLAAFQRLTGTVLKL